MIRQFCKGLPKFLSDQLFIEYEYRRRELEFLVTTYPQRYRWIEEVDSVRLLLALSIYFRRVISQLEAAGKTYFDLVGGDVTGVTIGQHKLSEQEAEELSNATSDFHRLLHHFGLYTALFDYYDTSGFLFKLKQHLENINQGYGPN
jgi:hypothetical protein